MLFILYGAALEVGQSSRKYFEAKSFEVIEKISYLSPISYLKTWLTDKTYADYQAVQDSNFHYELNGLHVGFSKAQVIDAVHGLKHCLLTMSTMSIEFIVQLKHAYGDFVTVVFSFIDAGTLSRMTKRQPGISDLEITQRLRVGEEIKQVYIDHSDLFDAVVLYSKDH